MLNCHEYDPKNRVREGRIPSRTVGLVIEASKHQNELMEDRELANNNQPTKKIATFTLKRREAHCRTK